MEKVIECISLDHVPHGDPVFFSIGYRSIGAHILKRLGLTTPDLYPFDDVITRLPVVKHCIETEFRYVLDASNYMLANTKTMQHATTSSPTLVISRDRIWFNTYYQNHAVDWLPVRLMQLPRVCRFPEDTHAYHFAVPMREGCVEPNVEDMRKRVERWMRMIRSPVPKRFLYVHPIIAETEYLANKYTLLRECIEFQEWFSQYTNHIRGCFVFLVRTSYPAPMTDHIPTSYPDIVDHVYCGQRWKQYDDTLSESSKECDIFVIYANRELEDAVDGYYGPCMIEMDALQGNLGSPCDPLLFSR
jgi:hypothetical protein